MTMGHNNNKNKCLLILVLLWFCGSVQADVFESLIMPGKVIQGHAKYEKDCAKCHQKKIGASQKGLCLDCHKDINRDVKSKRGYHGLHKSAARNECKSCHVEHMGRDADIVRLDSRVFQHQFTDFPLQGAHKTLQCAVCHKQNKKYREAPSQCYQCHKDNPHKGRLGKKCTQCHSQVLWTELSFDHDKTDFKLTGKHDKIKCNSCHINNKYKHTPKTCFSCHGVDDVHNGRNGQRCAKCHDTRSWKNLKFDHNRQTKFKLLGRHKDVSCDACHLKNPYKVKIKQDCYSCHKKDDEHKASYGVKCQTCHGFNKWSETRFDHDRDTKYRLLGKHNKVACVGCHKGQLYKQKTPRQCIACHKLDDVHKGQTDKNCASCHSPSGWASKLSFDHDMSGFPLTGLHAIVACDDCHLSKQFKSASKQCLQCHMDDDVHKARLGPNCAQCHNTNGWNLWRFDHNKDTHFKLDGAHEKLHCYHCHATPAVNGIELNQSCGFCHAGDDPHNNQFGPLCEQCHDTESFSNINMAR